MLESEDKSDDQAVPVHEGLTAEWRPNTTAAYDPTLSFQLLSTFGPNDPLRQTLTRAESGAAEFPQLPGLKVVAYIDCGGMGHVYLAEQETPKRTVAVKIATSANRAGMVSRERFDREIQALAAIAHPNIMPIYTAGDWHGFPYYSMRYMVGGPLSKQLPRFEGQPKAAALLMRKVARGLQALHEAKIIHRDLKPHNILLDEHDEPVIADFGLAKWIDGESDLTVTASALGTKFYMPPEQTSGSKEQFGPASDIWSFGIILFEMLTGTRPFREDLKPALYDQIRGAEPEIPDSVPDGLATIIRRCLRKSHLDRYPTAAALGEDLDRWLEGAPVDPLPAARIAPKSKRRIGRMVALGLALALVAGIAATTAAVWPAKKKSIAERLRAGETVTLIGEKGLPEDLGRAVPGVEGQLFLADNGYCSLMDPGLAVRLLSTEQIDLPVEVSVECAFPDSVLSQNPVNNTIYPYSGLVFGYRSTSLEARPQHHYLQLIQSYENPKNRSVDEVAAIRRMHWSTSAHSDYVTLERSGRTIDLTRPETGSLNWKRIALEIRSTELAGSMDGMKLKPLPVGGTLWRMRRKPETEPELGSAFGITTFLSQTYFRNLKIKPLPQ